MADGRNYIWPDLASTLDEILDSSSAPQPEDAASGVQPDAELCSLLLRAALVERAFERQDELLADYLRTGGGE